MRIIKRLDLYILKNYLLLFAGTFCISLFVVMMQFLWKYVDELIGKGLELSVMAKFFFYAAETLVPLALPLAILLASLISFGNLERGKHPNAQIRRHVLIGCGRFGVG